MEQLQMLKFMLKKDRLDFTPSWYVTEEDTEAENKWQDCAASVADPKGKDDILINSVLDLLGGNALTEQQVGNTGVSPLNLNNEPVGGGSNDTTEEVFGFNDDGMYFSDEN